MEKERAQRAVPQPGRTAPLTMREMVATLAAGDQRLAAGLAAVQAELVSLRAQLSTPATPPADFIPGHQVAVNAPSALPAAPASPAAAAVEPAPPEPPSAPRPDQPLRREKAPRIEYEGNCGGDPRASLSQSGKLIVKFPFALHPDEETTRWVTAVFFDTRAERLRALALNGKRATLIGGAEYERDEVEGGKTRRRRYINGYALKLHEE